MSVHFELLQISEEPLEAPKVEEIKPEKPVSEPKIKGNFDADDDDDDDEDNVRLIIHSLWTLLTLSLIRQFCSRRL